MTDEAFDRLILKDDLFLDPALDAWGNLLKDVREAYSTPLSRRSESRHIAAILDTVPKVMPKRRPAATLAVAHSKPTMWKRFRPPSMRRLVLANLMGSLVGKIMIVATAAAATTTGLAATGSLPEPIRSVITEAGDSVGAPANPPDQASPPAAHAPASPPSMAPVEAPGPEPVPAAAPATQDSVEATVPQQQAPAGGASGRQTRGARAGEETPWLYGSGTGSSQTNGSATGHASSPAPAPSPAGDFDDSWGRGWDREWSWNGDWDDYSHHPRRSETGKTPSSWESQSHPRYR
jgi:hypothetical protein